MILAKKYRSVEMFLKFHKCAFLDVNEYKIQLVHGCIKGCVLQLMWEEEEEGVDKINENVQNEK